VITVGGPAAAFARRYRAQLFPDAPMLFGVTERRFVRDTPLAANETAARVVSARTKEADSALVKQHRPMAHVFSVLVTFMMRSSPGKG